MTGPAWRTDDFPELRPGPPWVMEEMMARQVELAAQILAAPAAGAIAAAARRRRLVTVTGCGTSEHAAHADRRPAGRRARTRPRARRARA